MDRCKNRSIGTLNELAPRRHDFQPASRLKYWWIIRLQSDYYWPKKINTFPLEAALTFPCSVREGLWSSLGSSCLPGGTFSVRSGQAKPRPTGIPLHAIFWLYDCFSGIYTGPTKINWIAVVNHIHLVEKIQPATTGMHWQDSACRWIIYWRFPGTGANISGPGLYNLRSFSF